MVRFFTKANMKPPLNQYIIKICGLKEYIYDLQLGTTQIVFFQNQLKRLFPIHLRLVKRNPGMISLPNQISRDSPFLPHLASGWH